MGRLVSLVSLQTPPVSRIVPDEVFDAYGWCKSDQLDWGCPEGAALGQGGGAEPITAANPPGMVFVMRGGAAETEGGVPPGGREAPGAFLPRELASLHVPGLGLQEEWALAPWAIDDATDLLYERRVRPRDLLWLATGSVAGLFWGLHDWAHFHNHGAFEPHQRAWTELQCDATALVWAWINRAAIGLDAAAWERARREVLVVGAARFAEQASEPFDPAMLDADRLRALAP